MRRLTLWRLSDLTGCWVAWDDAAGEPVPVPMGEWIARYRAWPWRTGADGEGAMG